MKCQVCGTEGMDVKERIMDDPEAPGEPYLIGDLCEICYNDFLDDNKEFVKMMREGLKDETKGSVEEVRTTGIANDLSKDSSEALPF